MDEEQKKGTKKGGFAWCSAINCRNNSGMPNSTLSFFRFPKDPVRCKEWIIRSRRQDLEGKSSSYLHSNTRLCSEHFEDSMFLNYFKNRLHTHAVPSKFNVPNPPPLVGSSRKPPKKRQMLEISLDKCSNRESDYALGQLSVNDSDDAQMGPEVLRSSDMQNTSNDAEYLRLKKIINQQRVKIHRLKKRNEELEQKLKASQGDTSLESLCEKFLPVQMKNFILMFEKGKSKCLKKRHDLRSFSLGLYFLSPKAYSFVRNFLPLVSPRTIRRILSSLPVTTGLSDWILKNIEVQVNVLGNSSRDCLICMDEVTLKPHLFYNISKDEVVGIVDMGDGRRSSTTSNAAFVVMVRGITVNWKQAIGYFFVKESCPALGIKDIIFDAIRKLTGLGLKVHGVVSDQGSNFQQLARILGVTPTRPYFNVDDKVVNYIFDVPHLLKSIRNNLINHKFYFDGHVACWDDVEALYNADKQQSLRLAVKLNDAMINPNNFMKMKVKYAAKALSHTVAAALETHARLGTLPASALGTAKFCDTFDKLFDCLNSSSLKSKKMYRSAITVDSPHVKFLQDALIFINGIKVISKKGLTVTGRVKCIYGWKVTISSVLHMWKRLHENDGMSFLLTRQLNQDPLENFFGDIRKQGGNCDHPSPFTFQTAFKKLLLTSIKNPIENGNCLADVGSFMTNVKSFVDFTSGCGHTSPQILRVNTHDYRQKLLQENAEVYVSGYIFKKCLQQHSCEICMKYSQENNMMVDPSQLFCSEKAFSGESFGGLCMPNVKFVNYISLLNREFEREFSKCYWESQLGKKILNSTNCISLELPCPEFPLDYCIKLFIRMKIYHSFKDINKRVKGKVRKNRKSDKINVLST